MTLLPVFPIRLLMLALPVAIAVGIYAGTRNINVFKKQGVAWVLTALMIVAAIGIGYGKAAAGSSEHPEHPEGSVYIRDDAGVLSASTENALAGRNARLLSRYKVAIGVLTCNYGRDDLYDYALKRAKELDLRDYDMLVVLDIKGKTYGMIQGAALVDDFTDDDCDRYAWDYMERDFDRGNYDAAVLSLTEMLEAWYGTYYG